MKYQAERIAVRLVAAAFMVEIAACAASPEESPSSGDGSLPEAADAQAAAVEASSGAGTDATMAEGGVSEAAAPDGAAAPAAHDAGGPEGAMAAEAGVKDAGARDAADAAGGDAFSGPGADASGGDAGQRHDAAADASGGSFVLAWQDDFNTLDPTVWQLESFTYAGNLAQFTPQNASVANGVLTISLTANSASTIEPYFGVEMRSLRTLTYGKVSASMRFAHGSGVVSGLVLFYTPFPDCNWNEIDIEHLGDSSNTSQLNAQVFTGSVVPTCTTSVTPIQDPLVVNLGVNAETAFHQYDIEWTPAGVTTFVDGVLLRTWTTYSALMNLPQNVLLTIWASSSAGWAGAIQPASAPTSADVDWIQVYDWTP